MSVDVIFVSGEASGDELSVEVINHIRSLNPALNIDAIGGPELSKVGITSSFDVSALSIVGYADALKIWRTVTRLVEDIVSYIADLNPKAVVLVDSWGFTIRVAKRLKEKAPHIKRIKLIGPQVWATRPGRAKALADRFDHLLCIHDFEVPFYTQHDLPCTVIGIPAISRMNVGNGAEFRKTYNVSDDEKLVVILPGSRAAEIRRVAPTFVKAAEVLKETYQGRLRFVVIESPSVKSQLEELGDVWPENTVSVSPEGRENVMAAADFAFACSGTVTTELATQGCPMAVGYRLGYLTWFLADNFLFKAPYISLINVAANRAIVPEYVQNDFTPSAIVEEALRVLTSEEYATSISTDLLDIVRHMGWGAEPASAIAAEKIVELTA